VLHFQVPNPYGVLIGLPVGVISLNFNVSNDGS
jgi:hypothetical protein